MKNSILTLIPYKFHGQWVFDDESTGLYREAFISGIDKMLDQLTEEVEDAENGFILIFSEKEFPDYQLQINWIKSEYGGNWYHCEKYEIDGWLCPALFKYFEVAPKSIFVQAKEKK